jgi:ribosome-associated translation inhibitor RaiA
MFAKICGDEIEIVDARNKISETKMKKWDMYFDYEKESSKEPNYGWYRKHDKNRRYKK